MAKLGDRRSCVRCNDADAAVLKLLPPSLAPLSGVADGASRESSEHGERLAWLCNSCGHEQPCNDRIEP